MPDIVPVAVLPPTRSQQIPCGDALTIYLDTLSSPATRRAYSRHIRLALDALRVATVDAIAPGNLTAYRAQLVARLTTKDAHHRLSAATIALSLTAVRAFLKFARVTGATPLTREVIDFCLTSPSAVVQKPYSVLSDAEQGRMLDAAEASGNVRDHALIALFLGSGIRVAEMCQARIGDLSADDDGDLWLRVRLGKGRKDRLVPLASDVAAVLGTYLETTGRAMHAQGDQESPLFLSRQGDGILTTTRLYQLVQDYARAAGVTTKHITPHSLRHTYAISQLRAGASPIVVQKLLGHASVQTTQKYLDHLDRVDLKRWARSPRTASHPRTASL